MVPNSRERLMMPAAYILHLLNGDDNLAFGDWIARNVASKVGDVWHPNAFPARHGAAHDALTRRDILARHHVCVNICIRQYSGFARTRLARRR